MIAAHDTVKGVHFHFNKETKYWSFVRAIDICNMENANRYIANGNNIWVANTILPQDAKREFLLSGCIVYSIIEIKKESTINEKIKSIAQIIKPHLPSIAIFVIMILLTIKQVYTLSKP